MLAALTMIGMFLAFVVFCVLFILGIFFQSDFGISFVKTFNWATTNGLGALVVGILFLFALAVVAFINFFIFLMVYSWVTDRDATSPWEPFIAAPLAFMWLPGFLMMVWGQYKMIAVGSLILFALPVLVIWWVTIREYMWARRAERNEAAEGNPADAVVDAKTVDDGIETKDDTESM